jgi:hypothetical protein
VLLRGKTPIPLLPPIVIPPETLKASEQGSIAIASAREKFLIKSEPNNRLSGHVTPSVSEYWH